jgi:hypothetical protein
MRALLRGIAAVVLATCGLRAQTVHGHVEADVTKERLAGGVVVAVDAAGHGAAPAAITNANGEFALRFRSPGRYALSVRRLGYRPISLSIDVGASDTTVTVRMSPVPVRLQAVATRSSGQCRIRPTTDSALWEMWSAAELAMLNATVASGTGEYRFDTEFFTRTYDIPSAKIVELSWRDTAIVGGRPWASLSGDSLNRAGFVSATEDHMTFIGPDLSALLSPAFLDNHCFSIHRAIAEDSALVGLDFAPAVSGRPIDIRGTFWLERNTAELRALTFYYDRLPFVGSDTLAGGRIEFAHLSSGAWVLTHWSIRAPLPSHVYLINVANSAAPDAYHAERVVNATDPRFGADALRVTGGSVRAVRHEGTSSALWTAPVSTLTVHVRERRADSTYAAAEGDVVRLRGSTRQAISDKNGDAIFPDLLPGEYIVEAAGPTQDALELPPAFLVVVVRAPAAVSAEAHVMSDAVAIHTACGILAPNRGVLSGRVVRDALPADDERVSVVSNHFGGTNFRLDGIRADSDGRFRACGVPKGEALVASVVSYRKVRASGRVIIPVTERFGWMSLDLGRTPPK